MLFAAIFPAQEELSVYSKPYAGSSKEFGRSRRSEADKQQMLLARRRTITVLSVTALGVLLGGWYFFHTLLAFKTGIVAKATEIPGPYPNGAVIFLVIPAFCGVFYVALDYFGAKTGFSPYGSRQGIAVAIITFLFLCAVSRLPGAVIRHVTNEFAESHGYAMCSSPFDPQHVHVYALQSYVAGYGCPTVGPPQ